ncbi:uncharacterized protein [Aegilops tauschii subsp. strangulata]|uniref:uncharacterized protein n=1 Tax=Aegilops tauschii subsp. strangulata TaxID=200361 RepID=UPI003CC8C559
MLSDRVLSHPPSRRPQSSSTSGSIPIHLHRTRSLQPAPAQIPLQPASSPRSNQPASSSKASLELRSSHISIRRRRNLSVPVPPLGRLNPVVLRPCNREHLRPCPSSTGSIHRYSTPVDHHCDQAGAPSPFSSSFPVFLSLSRSHIAPSVLVRQQEEPRRQRPPLRPVDRASAAAPRPLAVFAARGPPLRRLVTVLPSRRPSPPPACHLAGAPSSTPSSPSPGTAPPLLPRPERPLVQEHEPLVAASPDPAARTLQRRPRWRVAPLLSASPACQVLPLPRPIRVLAGSRRRARPPFASTPSSPPLPRLLPTSASSASTCSSP